MVTESVAEEHRLASARSANFLTLLDSLDKLNFHVGT